MDFNNLKLPNMATNPPLPNIVYEKMREQEWHDEAIEKEERKISLLVEQNKLLKSQNEELKEANCQSNKELEKSKHLNIFMAVMAVLSFAATVTFELLPLFAK